ncbi:MAG: apolipoprotein N-acyltransferase, partial [Planctomycetales bacterium]|nr:apolipoprotein N-acyltransferase [Planctomycetales bacterium]
PGNAGPTAPGVLGVACLGSLAAYLAHPPVGWGLLAWIAPAVWVDLVRRPSLEGRRPYLSVYAAGFLYWLLTTLWIRLPHPANHAALLILPGYLALYLTLFVAMSRRAVHAWRIPVWLACPVTWTGLEWARAHLLTGFAMGSLAHTQSRFPALIQVADLVGEYGVDFLLLLVASSVNATVVRLRDSSSPSRTFELLKSVSPALVGLSAALAYGQWRLPAHRSVELQPVVALIQGDSHADWKGSVDRDREIMDEHWRLSREAAEQAKREFGTTADVMIWPETMFRYPLVTRGSHDRPARSNSASEPYGQAIAALQLLAKQTGSAFIVGVDRFHLLDEPSADAAETPAYEVFNSCAAVDASGAILGTYDKRHLLPIGEYTPFADWFSFLGDLSPITGLARPGERDATFVVKGVRYAPNICYETALPHLIRRQVDALTQRSERPDVLVNLTNDAWYWGSSELDMHLACDVFRAVEMRTPLIAAANRGLSAVIDATGRVVAVSGRNRAEALCIAVPIVQTAADSDASFYAAHGDWFAASCLALALATAWRAAPSSGGKSAGKPSTPGGRLKQ